MLDCPLCRATFPHRNELQKVAHLLEMRAKEGKSWAQVEIGLNHFEGRFGLPVDKIEAFKWFELAAEQRHPVALCKLADYYIKGLGGDASIACDSKSRALMKDSADLGYFYAQVKLGSTYFLGVGGTVDKAKSAYYYTLAHSQDPDSFPAHRLGFIFLEGSGGMKKSLYRAKYYIQRSAEKGLADAYTPLALILLELPRVQYDGKVISGHNCIPRALF
mmetsp:Transcript_41388/g.74617  ORF Transcript_41388/g.74617 Transcript_41388/m.74617 type:complete len:218 (-) Transcript_41388:215-868(-)